MWRKMAVGLAALIGVTACGPVPGSAPTELPSTRRADDIDPPNSILFPASPRGPLTNQPELTGIAARELVREKLAEVSNHVENFEPGYNLFFLLPHFSGFAGLCAATAISIDGNSAGRFYSQEHFLVVGGLTWPQSLAETQKPASPELDSWRARINANCAARKASHSWFTVVGSYTNASDSAKLFDGIIATARRPFPVPFKLKCDPKPERKSFCVDPRKTLATFDPSDIAAVEADKNIDGGIVRLTTSITTHGDEFWYMRLTIHQESPYCPGCSIHWATTEVEISQSPQPIIN
jgi:hypothetical protein